MSKPIKQMHLAAHFPGVNNTTVWTDPASGSQIEFDSFVHMARTAERGLFDFLFLAEGLRLREHRGQIYDLDVVGRPDTFTVLAAAMLSKAPSFTCQPMVRPGLMPKLVGLSLVEEKLIERSTAW